MRGVLPVDALTAWAALVMLTLVSFALGGTPSTGAAVTSLVLALTFVKAGLIGAVFMEVRSAPAVLRCLFLSWLIGTAGLLIVLVDLGF